MQRRRVDLPLPDNPIKTKISFSRTSNETSFTAITCPVCSMISCLVAPSSSMSQATFGLSPNIFHTFWHEIAISFFSDISHLLARFYALTAFLYLFLSSESITFASFNGCCHRRRKKDFVKKRRKKFPAPKKSFFFRNLAFDR